MIGTIQDEMNLWLKEAASFSDEILERSWKWKDYDEGIRFSIFRLMEELTALINHPKLIRDDRRISQQGEVKAYLMRFHQVFWELKAQLAGMGEELVNTKPAPDEWTIRQTLEHILNVEWMFLGVFRYGCLLGASSEVVPAGKIPKEFIDQHFDVDGHFPPNEFDCQFSELLHFYEERHQEVISSLISLKENDLDRPLTFWESEAMPARFRLIRFESHLRQHLIQIQKTNQHLHNDYSELRSLLRECASLFSVIDWYLMDPEQLNLDVLTTRWDHSVRPYLRTLFDTPS